MLLNHRLRAGEAPEASAKTSSVAPPRIVPAVDPKKAGSKKGAPSKDRQAELLAMKEQFEHLASGQGAPLGKGTPSPPPVPFHAQPRVESRETGPRRRGN